MSAMFREGFKQVREPDGSTLSYGEVLGAHGFAFEQCTQERQGPHYCELSMRRVVPSGRQDEELQLCVEITQRYTNGSNSRRMFGSMTLRGKALEAFCRRVLERADSLKDIKPL